MPDDQTKVFGQSFITDFRRLILVYGQLANPVVEKFSPGNGSEYKHF